MLFRITFRCIRIWQLPAQAAVASGRVGLAVLSPLMADTDAATVTEAANLVRAQVQPEQGQDDLLTLLGALSEGLADAATLKRTVGEKFVIRSKFIGSIVEDEVNRRMDEIIPRMEAEFKAAERASEEARQQAKRQAEEARQQGVREGRLLTAEALEELSLRMVEDTIAVRFPAIAFPLVRPILGAGSRAPGGAASRPAPGARTGHRRAGTAPGCR